MLLPVLSLLPLLLFHPLAYGDLVHRLDSHVLARPQPHEPSTTALTTTHKSVSDSQSRPVSVHFYHLTHGWVRHLTFRLRMPILHSALQLGESSTDQLHFLVSSDFRSKDPTTENAHFTSAHLCQSTYTYEEARLIASRFLIEHGDYKVPFRNCHHAMEWLARQLCKDAPVKIPRRLNRASRWLNYATLGINQLLNVDIPQLAERVRRTALKLIGKEVKRVGSKDKKDQLLSAEQRLLLEQGVKPEPEPIWWWDPQRVGLMPQLEVVS